MWQCFLNPMELTYRKAKWFGKIKNRSKVLAALGVPIFSKFQNWYGPSFKKLLVVFLLCTSQSNPAKHLILSPLILD